MAQLSRQRAFAILGVEPTSDGRTIRNAFVRLARIYHPDRFASMPPDVRAEAERRMKDATIAYEFLRSKRTASTPATPPKPRRTPGTHDAWEDARRWREQIEARRHEDEKNRARWQLWDQLEREARQRAEWEADLAAKLAADMGGVYEPKPPSSSDPAPKPAQPTSLLAQRLAAAKNGGVPNDRALAPRENRPA